MSSELPELVIAMSDKHGRDIVPLERMKHWGGQAMRFAFLLTIALLSSCATTPSKETIDAKKMEQLRPGQTTKQEVLVVFGSPEAITKDAQGNELYVYTSKENKEFEGMMTGGVIGVGTGAGLGMLAGLPFAVPSFGASVLIGGTVGGVVGGVTGGVIGAKLGEKEVTISSRLVVQLDENDIVRDCYDAVSLQEKAPGDQPRDINVASTEVAPWDSPIDSVRLVENAVEDSAAFAVVVGIDKYQRLPAAPYAEKDAFLTRLYFINNGRVPKDNVYYLVGQKATLANMKKTLDPEGNGLAKRITRGQSRLYVYFSGHGLPDWNTKEVYLVPYDGDPDAPKTSCYSLNELIAGLQGFGAGETIVVLDSCFSGETSGGRGQSLFGAARGGLVLVPEVPKATETITMFYACEGNQTSNAYPDMKHGLFTYYFLKGFAGDADGDQDSKVTVGELSAYLPERISSQAAKMGKSQNPVIDADNVASTVAYCSSSQGN